MQTGSRLDLPCMHVVHHGNDRLCMPARHRPTAAASVSVQPCQQDTQHRCTGVQRGGAPRRNTQRGHQVSRERVRATCICERGRNKHERHSHSHRSSNSLGIQNANPPPPCWSPHCSLGAATFSTGATSRAHTSRMRSSLWTTAARIKPSGNGARSIRMAASGGAPSVCMPCGCLLGRRACLAPT
eukprot:366462-Chlamydomonas_euryale.AAC.18